MTSKIVLAEKEQSAKWLAEQLDNNKPVATQKQKPRKEEKKIQNCLRN